MIRLVTLLLAAVLVGCGGVNAADAPPAGAIWFGSSFDTTTFEMTGRTSDATVGQTVALVASLPRAVSSGEINMQVEIDGTGVLNQALAMTGSGSYFGTTYGPLPVPGTYVLQITDIGGAVLASGTLTVQ